MSAEEDSRGPSTTGSSHRESIGRNSFRDKLFQRPTFLRREFLRRAGEHGEAMRANSRARGTVILALSRNKYLPHPRSLFIRDFIMFYGSRNFLLLHKVHFVRASNTKIVRTRCSQRTCS